MTAKAHFAMELILPEYVLRSWEEPAITCTVLAWPLAEIFRSVPV